MIADTRKGCVMLADLAKRLLYASGALGLYHSIRNRNQLTVVMFHRVLDPADPRWKSCDPDYTLPVDLFIHSLEFFRRHYNVVAMEDVLAARHGRKRLPPRPLLITFDDGWADNADFALSQLHERGLPALMFVVADAVGARQPFYQERIFSAWRRGTLQMSTLREELRALGADAGALANEEEAALRGLIGVVEELEPQVRAGLLERLAGCLDDELRHMVDSNDLRRLQEHGVALGLHGRTHTPMTRAIDLDDELSGARATLAKRMEPEMLTGETMSFPHGAHDAGIALRAREAGYELVFTSVPALNPVRPTVGWLLGRTGFEANAIRDAKGRFRPDWLALYLFRKPSRSLAADYSSSSADVR
jgi:peptidoglycan/xylan/chitin deacetylase (PgdA/CDA1 family)